MKKILLALATAAAFAASASAASAAPYYTPAQLLGQAKWDVVNTLDAIFVWNGDSGLSCKDPVNAYPGCIDHIGYEYMTAKRLHALDHSISLRVVKVGFARKDSFCVQATVGGMTASITGGRNLSEAKIFTGTWWPNYAQKVIRSGLVKRGTCAWNALVKTGAVA
jgi:opacity protein-like surface antigen